jgi:hypothetical protein
MKREHDPVDDPTRTMQADLEALRRTTARDLPDLDTTARQWRLSSPHRAASREGWFMNAINPIGRRPWRAAAFTAAAIAVALLFVPFSYERQLGQEVAITLAGDVPEADVRSLADALRGASGAREIQVDAGGGGAVTVTARFPGRSAAEASAVARAVERRVEAMGFAAAFQVRPWVEEVTGNVYAQVSDRWREVRVETQGRSEAEIEKDVQAQLERWGFANPQVTYRRSGDSSRLEMRAAGKGEEVIAHVERRGEGGGAEPPVHVALPDFSDLKGWPPEKMKAEIERRLRERGVEAEVIVAEDGKVEIKAKREGKQ